MTKTLNVHSLHISNNVKFLTIFTNHLTIKRCNYTVMTSYWSIITVCNVASEILGTGTPEYNHTICTFRIYKTCLSPFCISCFFYFLTGARYSIFQIYSSRTFLCFVSVRISSLVIMAIRRVSGVERSGLVEINWMTSTWRNFFTRN